MQPAPRKSLEPWLKDEVNYYPHQTEGVRDLARRRSFLLADEMGLGKSLQALTVFAIDVVRGWGSKAIVICPVTLKGNWADEVIKFTRFPAIVLEGTPVQRKAQLQEFSAIDGPKILIVNYEQVTAHLADLNAMKFDVSIFDEAHYLKNPKAKRTKACQDLIATRSFMLTGTPMLNNVNELWSILHRIDPKGFPSYWSFLNRYCVFGGYKDKQIVGVKNEKELTEKLQKYMLRRLKKDVLNLKEPQVIPVRVDLTPEQQKLYDEVINEMRLTNADTGTADDIENALTKFLRLKQICGTTFPFTGQDHSNKLDRAVEIAVELLRSGEKTVVFTQFRDVLEMFARRLDAVAPEYNIWELHGGIKKEMRQPFVNDWSADPNAAVLLCMLQVAGIGLNMTAARHMIFLDKLFVPGLNKQAIDRCHRIGQDETQSVQVYEMITRNTVENRVEQILRTKVKLNDSIVEVNTDWKRMLVRELLKKEDDD